MKGVRRLIKDYRKVLLFLRNRQTFLFALFFIISLVFWFLQTLQETYEDTIEIPVVIDKIPSDIAVSETLPEFISVKVRDNGFGLLNYAISNAIDPIVLPFVPDESRSGQFEWTTAQLENELISRLSINGKRSTVITFSPQFVRFSYSPKAKREVPIDFKGQIIPAVGSIITDVTLEPDKVIVYGNKTEIDTLEIVRTDTLTYDNISKSTVLKVPLVASKGVTLTPADVSLVIKVERLVQRTISVPVTSSYSSHVYTLRLFPSVVDVLCILPESRLKELLPSDISVQIEANEVSNIGAKGKLRLEISKYPDYVQVIQTELDQVEYILEER